MNYVIKMPAILGDVIPLCFVTETLAGFASTGFGTTSPHKPIYDCQIGMHRASLLREARAGRLHVCNQAGYMGTVDEIIDAVKISGDLSEVRRFLVKPDWEKLRQDNPPVVEGALVWNFSGVDLGETETDWDATYCAYLHTKLHCLNEWGKTTGNEFSIENTAGWVDERGYMNLQGQSAPTAKGEAVSHTNSSVDNWEEKALAITNDIARKRYENGVREITARNICDAVATELEKDNSTHGQRGPRCADSIRTTVLKGWKFTPLKPV